MAALVNSIQTNLFQVQPYAPKRKALLPYERKRYKGLKPVIEYIPNISNFKHENKPVYIGQNFYIRPTYIVSMAEYSGGHNTKSQKFIDNQANLLKNQHGSEVSKKADKNIKNCVNWLLASAKEKTVYQKSVDRYFKFKVNFITLTLPDTEVPVTEKQFKQDLLNPFLVNLRKNYGLKNYLWKVEFQENGKLHVHITTDTFIHWRTIRNLWNKRLYRNGLLTLFSKNHGHYNPNSTDVHAVWKVKNLAAYIAKYLSKRPSDKHKISGRIWDCNEQLMANSKPKVFIPSPFLNEEIKPLMRNDVDYKTIYSEPNALGLRKIICDIFLMKSIVWQSLRHTQLYEVFRASCWRIRNLISDLNVSGTIDFDSPILYEV